MPSPYFSRYEKNHPPEFPGLSPVRQALWHVLAGVTIGFGTWYLVWRWTQSINPEAPVFSVIVALAETLCFIGTLLFFHDIWREEDTASSPPPNFGEEVGLHGGGPIAVDVLITTYDEPLDIVGPSIAAARQVTVPEGTTLKVWLCDDGNRSEMASLAAKNGINYLARDHNRGFKAGNLRNALLATQGDFIVICDADTRLLPSFLINTLGYFRDPKVAWVQTPHWFYDIPEGASWREVLHRRFNKRLSWLARGFEVISGKSRVGEDPFLSRPHLFFDIIQRRRNRNGASFCCGAASIHRREAVYQGALAALGRDLGAAEQRIFGQRKWPWQKPSGHPAIAAANDWLLPAVDMQPFRFHVSEDILTSIRMHSDSRSGWRSVYHAQAESRMLSPWSVKAWAVQKLKYAGGTYDIMLRDNPLFKKGMPWKTKLHYASTFWSYLSALWMPILLLAPAISLVFAISPVQAYSVEFFGHFLPAVIASELAMLATCKGYAFHQGRILALAALPIQWRALVSVVRGKRPSFPVTPKERIRGGVVEYLWPNLAILCVFAVAVLIGVARHLSGDQDIPLTSLVTNLVWIAFNALAIAWILPAPLFLADGDAPTAPHPSLVSE